MLSSKAENYISNIIIEGLTLNSVNDRKGTQYEVNSLTSNVQAIYIQGVENLTINDVEMNNMYNGLKLNASESGMKNVNVRIEHLRIFNSRTPVYADGTDGFIMTNSILDAGGGATHWLHCVYINADTNNFIFDNVQFKNSPGGGVTIGSSYSDRAEPTNITVNNCIIENSKQGVNIYGATNVTISNSNISKCNLGLALHDVSDIRINNLWIGEATSKINNVLFDNKDIVGNLITLWVSAVYGIDETSGQVMKSIMTEYFIDNTNNGAFEMSEISNSTFNDVTIDAKGMAGSLFALKGKVEDVTLSDFSVTNMEDIGFFETASNAVNNLIVEKSVFEWTKITTRRINFRTAGSNAVFRDNSFINKGDLFDSLVYSEKGTDILLENNSFSGFKSLVFDAEYSLSNNNLNLDTQVVDKDVW